MLSFGQKEVLDSCRRNGIRREEQPVVALTFDDGPSGTSTPVLLEGLRKRGVCATFFVVGEKCRKGENAQILREMSADGHLIGESYISSCKSVENVSRTGTGRTECNG